MSSKPSLQKLRLSINPGLINKNEANDDTLYRSGWINKKLTPGQLAAEINKGAAYCCELSGNRRAANFVCSDVISVDIDGTRTITDTLNDPLVQEHLTIFYKTPSHTEQRERFRLIFALPRSIELPNEMVAASRSLTLRLGGDRSATDASRIFFGSRGSHPTVFDRRLSVELLDQLILQGLQSDQRDGNPQVGYVTTVSMEKISPVQILQTASGNFIPFGDIELKTRVHCPFHYDDNASAFILESRNGTKGLRCSTCSQTFWPPGTAHGYDFDDFDKRVVDAEKYFAANKDVGSFQQFMEKPHHPGLATSNIFRQEDQFLQLPAKLPDGLVFIKSPKGTGKTEQIARIVADSKRSTLLIGHRIALIRQSCVRLGLECYLDYNPKGGLASKHLGVCLDSLHRLKWQERSAASKIITKDNLFQTIIIDESEQVLSHFLSDTIDATSRDQLFKMFSMLLREAKQIIALDADLGWLTFETLTKLAQVEREDAKPSAIFLNTQKADSKVEIFASKNHLIGDMKQALADDRRVFVTSNSMALLNNIFEGLVDDFGENKRAILITSETTQRDEVKEFIANPSKRTLQYDAVLTSPSLGTGVDITFDNREKLVDVVYGFFEGAIFLIQNPIGPTGGLPSLRPICFAAYGKSTVEPPTSTGSYVELEKPSDWLGQAVRIDPLPSAYLRRALGDQFNDLPGSRRTKASPSLRELRFTTVARLGRFR